MWRSRNPATSGSLSSIWSHGTSLAAYRSTKRRATENSGYDGKMFYFTQAGVSSVQVMNPTSGQIVAQIPTGVSPHFVGYPRNAAFGIVVVQGPGELLLFDPA